MLSIAISVCATQDEAASVAESLSSSGAWEGVLIAATSEAEELPVICAFTRTTPTANASGVTADLLGTLVHTAWACLTASDPPDCMH